MTDFPLTGGCNCGAVRYEVTARRRRREVVLWRLWVGALRPQSPPRRSDRHPDGHVGRRSGDPAQRPPVRGVCGAVGADPGRRAAALSRKPSRPALTLASAGPDGKRERDLDRRPFASGAPHDDRAAQGLYAVAQPDETGAARRVRAADAVVPSRDVHDAISRGDVDVDARRLRVLGGVGDDLGDGVVGGDLDAVGDVIADIDVERDGYRRAARERPQGGTEPALGEDRRVDSSRDVAERLERPGQTIDDLRQLGPDLGDLRRYAPGRPAAVGPRRASRARRDDVSHRTRPRCALAMPRAPSGSPRPRSRSRRSR